MEETGVLMEEDGVYASSDPEFRHLRAAFTGRVPDAEPELGAMRKHKQRQIQKF